MSIVFCLKLLLQEANLGNRSPACATGTVRLFQSSFVPSFVAHVRAIGLTRLCITGTYAGRETAASLAYLRDRVGVPRDMRYPAARQLRAHLNWFIDGLAAA